MSLPSSWVNQIFSKLTVAYGHRFLSQYSGIDLDLVKADWGDELAAYQQAPSAIKHALSILPSDNPPNVFQFRDLCRRAPQYAPKALPAPTPDPEVVKAVRATLKPLSAIGSTAWAEKLRDRIKAGYRPTMFQRDALAEVLGTSE